MSTPIWDLAGLCDVVPLPSDDVLRRVVTGWWDQPRSFGCTHVAGDDPLWWVVWPAPQVWCGRCALKVHEQETRCVYCGLDVADDTSEGRTIVHESRGFVEVMAKAHNDCAKAAMTR